MEVFQRILFVQTISSLRFSRACEEDSNNSDAVCIDNTSIGLIVSQQLSLSHMAVGWWKLFTDSVRNFKLKTSV